MYQSPLCPVLMNTAGFPWSISSSRHSVLPEANRSRGHTGHWRASLEPSHMGNDYAGWGAGSVSQNIVGDTYDEKQLLATGPQSPVHLELCAYTTCILHNNTGNGRHRCRASGAPASNNPQMNCIHTPTHSPSLNHCKANPRHYTTSSNKYFSIFRIET